MRRDGGNEAERAIDGGGEENWAAEWVELWHDGDEEDVGSSAAGGSYFGGDGGVWSPALERGR